MLYRRVAGLFAGLLMVQLILAGSDLLCLRHSADTHTAAGSAHDHGTPKQEQPAGDLAQLPDCCPAMTTCTVSYAPRPANDGLLLAFAHVGARGPISALPDSRTETPDPPPPKA